MDQKPSLDALLPLLATEPGLKQALLEIGSNEPQEIVVAPSIYPFVAATMATRAPLLLATATGREAADLAAALRAFLSPSEVVLFPAWETLPHERLSPRSDTVGERLSVLRRLSHPDEGRIQVVVAPIRAVLQPFVRGLGNLSKVKVATGDEISLDSLVRSLADAAYIRTELVERRGEFAVRGGIVDVFPPTEEHPLRIEFWGDRIEEIRFFKVADQRSLEVAGDGLIAPPCRELLLTEAVQERARSLLDRYPYLLDVLGRVSEGIAVEGMESLTPVLVDEMELLFDVMPEGTHFVLCDPERIRTRAADLVATGEEFLDASWANAAAGNATPIDLGASSYKSLDDLHDHAGFLGIPWWTLTPFTTDDAIERIEIQPVDPYRGNTDQALLDIKEFARNQWLTLVLTQGHGPAERLVELFSANEIPSRMASDGDLKLETGVVVVATAAIDSGFIAPNLKLAVITESDIATQRGSTRDLRKMPSRRRNVIDPLDLKPGDYVVHEHHGVGRFVEMVQRTVAGAMREYLVIEYAPSKRGLPGDLLFAPTDSLDLITRYVGGEAPTVHHMGGADWQKAKGRARKAVREIAGELIRLYAARTSAPGFAFSPDTPWQRELEDAFAFVETPDQLGTIQEVKADMEKPYPMDRIVCGDVGYGKTEIAVRAAFKAVQDSKQVAILVPTTLLVQQHLNTFSERYSGFPVKVAGLSRFQTAKESAEILAQLESGTVDVVIGTHRLLSKDVKFKDLGLVVVDEEQRFGVEHKEALKHLRVHVDVLSMSATPIPRTLEMAVTGIREMSTITTPPEERHPVLTYVGPYEDKQIGAAIRRELLRDGQVFYVHNRVESIEKTAMRLQDQIPEARIRVAHGQMNEHELEKVIVGFWEKEFDVLVSTTIIESGIDIANANTLIVERADRFGLSQLHQIRGRVGRGRERAYAYFLYPREQPLSQSAHDRLSTIAANTDLGAGMKIAMKDLEIRGAGNLLGGEQSGHIADVGFDLYMRMVGEAVSEYKGEPIEISECKIDLPIDAHLPHEYIPVERLRLEAYRRLATAADTAEIADLTAELIDRYGSIPEPVANLLAVAEFRLVAKAAGLSEVIAQGSMVRLAPVVLAESAALRLSRLYPGSIMKTAAKILLVPRAKVPLGSSGPAEGEILSWTSRVIAALK
ncbi:MAG TPA: transcription-repair coupling factor [Candidatus Nanopelagicaceae bacterium]|nr:transcription-repair coupling factor [Candidatus Nanopelagicaceae bacterium]